MILETPQEMAMNVSQRFRAVRKKKGMTIKELSRRSGVPYSTIRRFEAKGEIAFLAFVKISSAMGEDQEIASLFANYVPSSIEEVIRGNRGKA